MEQRRKNSMQLEPISHKQLSTGAWLMQLQQFVNFTLRASIVYGRGNIHFNSKADVFSKNVPLALATEFA